MVNDEFLSEVSVVTILSTSVVTPRVTSVVSSRLVLGWLVLRLVGVVNVKQGFLIVVIDRLLQLVIQS